jgi:hypothetical protein
MLDSKIMPIGKLTRLGEYLRDRGMKQVEFAELAGVPAPMVSVWSRVESARFRCPGRRNAGAIADATRGAVPSSYWDELLRPPKAARRKSRRKAVHETA